MPRNLNPTPEDGRLVRDKNVLSILRLLHLFGHLRRQDFARYVWPKSPERSAYLMACRTVSRMLEKGLVLKRVNAFGGDSVVLASKGVAALKENGYLDAAEGYDLSPDGPQFFHRMLGNSYLLEKQRDGAEVYSEYALIRGKSPVSVSTLKERYSKAPDGLVIYDGSLRGMTQGWYVLEWVEVESAYKPYREIKKALQLLLQQDFELVSQRPGRDYYFENLVFVYDRRQKHEKVLISAIKRFLREVEVEYGSKYTKEQILSSIIFAPCHIDYPLTVRGFEEIPASRMYQEYKHVDELKDDT